MIHPAPVTLEGHGVRLEPMTRAHRDGIAAAAADGELWRLWFTAVPAPDQVEAYVDKALDGQRDGHMLPWVVCDASTGAVIGSTRYHDIVPAIDRVEIGIEFATQAFDVEQGFLRSMAPAANGPTSTRRASFCCWRTRSTRSGAPSWGFAPTTSTSGRSARSKASARKRTA